MGKMIRRSFGPAVFFAATLLFGCGLQQPSVTTQPAGMPTTGIATAPASQTATAPTSSTAYAPAIQETGAPRAQMSGAPAPQASVVQAARPLPFKGRLVDGDPDELPPAVAMSLSNASTVTFSYREELTHDEYHIPLIADEVQTGFGRTGKMFAVEYSGIEPDVIVLAKSLGGGLPLGAVVGRADLMDATNPGGLGGTFGGNPVACAAALAVIEVLIQEKLPERGQRLGDAAKATSAFAGLRTLLPAAAHVTLADLEDICDEARQLTRQERLHHWLHGWLLLHIPLSVALILLGAIHAVMALRY